MAFTLDLDGGDEDEAGAVEVARLLVIPDDGGGLVAHVEFADWLSLVDQVDGDGLIVMLAQQLLNEIDRDGGIGGGGSPRPTGRVPLQLVKPKGEDDGKD